MQNCQSPSRLPLEGLEPSQPFIVKQLLSISAGKRFNHMRMCITKFVICQAEFLGITLCMTGRENDQDLNEATIIEGDAVIMAITMLLFLQLHGNLVQHHDHRFIHAGYLGDLCQQGDCGLAQILPGCPRDLL